MPKMKIGSNQEVAVIMAGAHLHHPEEKETKIHQEEIGQFCGV